jgi:hypothetical protein
VWHNGYAARPEAAHVSLPLFGISESEAAYSQELSLPGLSADVPLENAYDEMELLGFSLFSPFAISDWKDEFLRLPGEIRNTAFPMEESEVFGRRQLPEGEVQKRIGMKSSGGHG